MQTKSSLEKHFQNIYTKLFSEYELVLSGHFGFNRFPAGIGHVDSFIGIKQKIDSKCYVGIRKVAKKGISIENILMYNGELFLNYEKELIDSHYQKGLDIMKELMGIGDKSYGYQISILSENTRGEGLGFTGTMFSLIVAGIGISIGKYKSNIFDDYETFQNSPNFNQIKTIAHQCVWDLKNGNVGPSFYTTLLNTAHPHVYLSEHHDIKKIEDIKFLKEYCHSLPEMLHIKESIFNTLPVHRAMIYTGQRANINMVEKQRKIVRMGNENYSDWFKDQNRDSIHSHLHEIFSKHSYYETIVNALNAMSTKTLYIFSQIYRHGPRTEYIQELINHFNTVHSLYNDVEEDSDIVDDFFESCTDMKVSPDIFGMFPIYTSKFGGNYIAIFQDESDLHILEDIIENMKNKYPHIRINSTYNFENPPSQGIKVEQNIFSDIKSNNTENIYVMIDNHGSQKICAYSDIEPEKSKGIFLDAVKNKVYINGLALSSKDIKSQTTTIEIFDLILQDSDFTIKNNQLGPSTFSGQQNQMLGKIIYPLTKLVQQKTGLEFPLECSGSLREFRISLGKTDIEVTLVKKL